MIRKTTRRCSDEFSGPDEWLTRVCATLGFRSTEMPDQAKNAMVEAERAGFELSLMEQNLKLSPEQRVWQHDQALGTAQSET